MPYEADRKVRLFLRTSASRYDHLFAEDTGSVVSSGPPIQVTLTIPRGAKLTLEDFDRRILFSKAAGHRFEGILERIETCLREDEPMAQLRCQVVNQELRSNSTMAHDPFKDLFIYADFELSEKALAPYKDEILLKVEPLRARQVKGDFRKIEVGIYDGEVRVWGVRDL